MSQNKIIKDNRFIIIQNPLGFKVTLCPLGASIYSIFIGEDVMTLTPKKYEDFANKKFYYGSTIGPMCARALDGKYVINGKEYFLKPNNGNICLHSGDDGFSNQIFKYEINDLQESTEVIFTLLVPDMSIGFPGDCKLIVKYIISDNSYDLNHIVSYSSSKDTLVSLTNHTFFSLSSKHNKDLDLFINSSNHVPLNGETLLPEEKMVPVDDVTNFKKPKPVFKDLQDPSIFNDKRYGYDHNFVLDSVNFDIPSVVLSNNKYKLEIFTDYSSIHIYSCNYNDNIEFINSDPGQYRGLAVEPQVALTKVRVLKANQSLTHKSLYKFTKK